MPISLNNFTKNNTVYGQFYEDENVFIFFGNKNFEKDHFSFFSDVKFHFLKQVHGNEVIEANIGSDVLKADGHYTNQKHLGLVIQTADCLPVMAYSLDRKWICALHAGWRGVVNRILPRGMKFLTAKSAMDGVSVFIGPHIQQSSFEVDADVCEQLKSCTNPPNDMINFDSEKNKYYPNLKKIVQLQLQETIKTEKLYSSPIDTFTAGDYSSFRRMKSPVRNWSFIYLK